MQRRDFISTLAAGTATLGATTGSVTAATGDGGTVPGLVFDSTASLLNESKEPLSDESVVAVWAEETAENTDSDGNGDAVSYPSDADIPLVAVDGSVVGIGCTFVEDGFDYAYGNEEFLLNAWDQKVGSGTVLWDEGHGQFFTKDKFASFVTYAEENGYTVESTTSLKDDLSSADGVVITSPSESFSDEELAALSEFAADGGGVFLHTQSDYNDYDQTDNINGIAKGLGVSFRFNDDQVVDTENNSGVEFVPTTTRFNESFDLFADRDGLELDADETYTVTVTEVFDGDTVKVKFDDDREDEVRILGIDTPEKPESRDAENLDEWEGIDDIDYLQTWSKKATEFAKKKLKGKEVTLSFDAGEGVRGTFGRLLGYIEYDDGGSKAFYNRQMIAQGYARVYGSSFSKHDAFRRLESEARDANRGLWAESDVDALPPIRNTPVEELYFAKGSSVKTAFGRIPASRVPVFAGKSATQTLEEDDSWFGGYFGDEVAYNGQIPLVGIDDFANVAMLGAPLAIDDYEKSDGYDVDTSEYDNYTFLANLIDALSSKDGDVLIDGGHGQVGADGTVASEDAAVFQRYLEGVDLNFDQANDLVSTDLSNYRAVIVAMPPEPFTFEEASALTEFAFDGGAVILLGATNAPEDARENLNDLARDVGTDLRLNHDAVTDESENVNDTPAIPVTSNFKKNFDLFSPYPVDDEESEEAGETFTGSLEEGEVATHTYAVEAEKPGEVRIDLSAAEDTDFDLYVTLDGREPTVDDYDRKSWGYGPDESVVVGGKKVGEEIGIAVDCYEGSSDYTVTVTEK